MDNLTPGQTGIIKYRQDKPEPATVIEILDNLASIMCADGKLRLVLRDTTTVICGYEFIPDKYCIKKK